VRKAGGKALKMHREIMHAPDHLVVDHIDHDGLHNRKRNLRLCTFAENCRNTRRTAPSTSKYKGVHWRKRTKKWAAAIRFDNKTYHLGCFDTELDAGKAYDQAAKKYHGAFASLNFPDLATEGTENTARLRFAQPQPKTRHGFTPINTVSKRYGVHGFIALRRQHSCCCCAMPFAVMLLPTRR
jgi:hypothetical protein